MLHLRYGVGNHEAVAAGDAIGELCHGEPPCLGIFFIANDRLCAIGY